MLASTRLEREDNVLEKTVLEKKENVISRGKREATCIILILNLKFLSLHVIENYYSCLKTVQVPVYSEQEYQMYLHDDGWTKAETDHLFDLCKRFDLRFIVIHDRYDHQQYRVNSSS